VYSANDLFPLKINIKTNIKKQPKKQKFSSDIIYNHINTNINL